MCQREEANRCFVDCGRMSRHVHHLHNLHIHSVSCFGGASSACCYIVRPGVFGNLQDAPKQSAQASPSGGFRSDLEHVLFKTLSFTNRRTREGNRQMKAKSIKIMPPCRILGQRSKGHSLFKSSLSCFRDAVHVSQKLSSFHKPSDNVCVQLLWNERPPPKSTNPETYLYNLD